MLSTVSRAGRVLDLFSAEEPEWGATAVAKELDIAKSQAHELLVSLTDIGLLERVGSGRYTLGWHLLALSSLLPDTSALRDDAGPAMHALAGHYGDSIQLAVWGAQRAVCIATCEGGRPDAVPPPSLGAGLPSHATALGKVLLASRPWDEVDDVIGRDGLRRSTRETIVTGDRLRSELAGVRARGLAYEDREHAPGTSAVAAPISRRPGAVVAAIGISAPAQRWNARKDEYARALLTAAAHISRRVCRRGSVRSDGDAGGLALVDSARG
jgi:IclR family KDG regulon transcriptional repressor